MTGISVVICCHNSRSRLEPTIRHLAAQKVNPEIPVEILLVDNSSSDGTAEFAQQLVDNLSFPFQFQIINEPQQGLSFARRAGINASKNDLIVFCDDDNWLDENYLALSVQIMTDHPECAVLGGQSDFATDSNTPSWFDHLKKEYAIGIQHESGGDVTDSRGYVWGAGMVLRKPAFNELTTRGFQFLLSDRKGSAIVSGGDTELCYALRLAGYRIRIDNRLKFTHFVPIGRLKWDYIIRLKKSFGLSEPVLFSYNFLHETGSAINLEEAWKTRIQKLRTDLFHFKKHKILRIFTNTEGNTTELAYLYKKSALNAFNHPTTGLHEIVNHFSSGFYFPVQVNQDL